MAGLVFFKVTSGEIDRQMRNPIRSVRWTNDGVAGGPDSIAILLAWLIGGNNYARWRSGDDKDELYREILAEFTRHGITHRERSGIIQLGR
ncbi:hypothetical protein PGTUg99_029165 [Puccinia graminis f. sp. tritici]|uniref:Uncharacterized protein n=1 Tax=Puccinia graminis f. sp. tritici TaxID=56615 RepID=A0A5B0RU60_PUCGR|nr:hypothetical protein PGTUg99_029165 [Puccinia graminis f. sp. tritici]